MGLTREAGLSERALSIAKPGFVVSSVIQKRAEGSVSKPNLSWSRRQPCSLSGGRTFSPQLPGKQATVNVFANGKCCY